MVETFLLLNGYAMAGRAAVYAGGWPEMTEVWIYGSDVATGHVVRMRVYDCARPAQRCAVICML